MSVIFIDGPDFSGKTTTAMESGDYSDWSVTRVGQELREYFCSAKRTSENTMAMCDKLWEDWMRIGRDRKKPIHVDRSPLSTYVEQIMHDMPEYEAAFVRKIAENIREYGPLVIKFISVSNDLLIEREERAGRDKDPREAMRSTALRNAQYHQALCSFTDSLGEHCKVTTAVEGDIITLTATCDYTSVLDFIESVSFEVMGASTEETKVELNDRRRAVAGHAKETPYTALKPTVGQLTEAACLVKEWLIYNRSLSGITIPRGSSIVTMQIGDNIVIESDGRSIKHGCKLEAISGYIARIYRTLDNRVCDVIMESDIIDIIGEYTTDMTKTGGNPMLTPFIAALILTQFEEVRNEY